MGQYVITLELGEDSAQYVYRKDGSVDTVAVAKLLEAKYSLFTVFFNANTTWIADKMAEGMLSVLEETLAGNPPSSPYKQIELALEQRFREFLDFYEAENQGIPNVPTKAARMGVRHGPRGKTSVGRRPSFVDTGLLRDNFRAWIENA